MGLNKMSDIQALQIAALIGCIGGFMVGIGICIMVALILRGK